MQDLLIVGCGGYSKSIIEIINKEEWNIVGLIGKDNELKRTIGDYEVIGTDKDLGLLREKYLYGFVAIGQIGSPNTRKMIVDRMRTFNYKFPKIISQFSIISKNACIKTGTSIGHGVIINSGAVINKHCIINTKALIEHDVVVGEFCHISTGAIINGGVKIGNNSFVGSGVIIREGLSIPPNSIISCGKKVMGWPLKEL